MDVSWNVLGRANHKRICACIEQPCGPAVSKVSVPLDLLHHSQTVAVRERVKTFASSPELELPDTANQKS
jgi:hypothetical protein